MSTAQITAEGGNVSTTSTTDAPQPPSSSSSSIPMSVLLELQHVGLEVALETTSGYTYRGKIASIDDNMGVVLNNAVVTNFSKTKSTNHSMVYLRGDKILFFVLPSSCQADYLHKAKHLRNRIHTQKQRRKRAVKRAEHLLDQPVVTMGDDGKQHPSKRQRREDQVERAKRRAEDKR